MAVLLDILLFGIIFLFALTAKKNNSLAAEATDLASMFFACFASVKFSNFLAKSTYTLFFRNEIAGKLLPLTQKIFRMDGQSTNLERVMRCMPSFIANGANWLVLDDETVPVLVDRYACHPAQQAAEEISDLIAGPVIEAVFYSVYLLLYFFMFNFIFKVIFSLLKADLKGIVEYNDIVLSKCVGAIRGFIFCLLLLALLRLAMPCFGFYGTFNDWVQDTIFFRIMFNDNILIHL